MNWMNCSKGWLVGVVIAMLGVANGPWERSSANDLSFRETIRNTDFAVGAVGGLRDQTSASLNMTGIKGTVTRAYLYWHGPMNTDFPLANASIRMDGQTITGVHIGTSDDNCWGFANSQAYRADVTAQVRAQRNGIYSLSQFVKQGTNINANGASLLVFFDDGKTNNNRDIFLFEGNDSNAPNDFDALGWNAALPGVTYSTGTAFLQMHVSDGQIYSDDSVVVNGTVLQGRGSIFQGVTVASDNNGPNGWGNLWDVKTWDITRVLARGTNDLLLTHGYIQHDCISLIVAAFNLPAAGGPVPPGGGTNNAPTVVGQPEITVHSPAPIVVEADAQDNDGDALDYSITVDSLIVQSGEIAKGSPQTIGRLSITNAFPRGDHLVVFTVSDGRTNASYTTLVHVIDNTPPVINATNIVVRADAGKTTAKVNYVVTATDDFPGDLSVLSLPAPGNDFPIGVTVVKVTAVDASGNRAEKTFTITVTDGNAPTPNCPQVDLIQFADAGTNVARVTYTVTVTDDQPGATVACLPASGSTFPIGTTSVTCTATDSAGNRAQCTFNVTVNVRPPVNRPPTVTGLTNVVINSNAPIVIDATAGDLDGNALAYVIRIDGVIVETGTLPAGTPVTLGTLSVTNLFTLGTHTVRFEVNDGQASASFTTTVRVIDDTPPVIVVPPDRTVFVDAGTDTAVVQFEVTVTDNFPGPVEVVVQPPSGSTFPIGTTTVVVIATDSSGNSSTRTFTITVVDNVAPPIACPQDVVQVADSGTNVARVVYSVTATDNVPGPAPTVVCVPPSGSLFPLGTTDVRCTATDAAGNRSECSFRVTVRERTVNRPPVLAGPTEINVYSNAPVTVAAVATDLDGDALTYVIRVDGVVVQTGTVPAGSPVTAATLGVTNTFTLGTHTVLFEVSDGLSTATWTTTVRVIDLVPPVIHATNILVELELGATNAVVTFPVTATDNFPGLIDLVIVPPSGSVFPLGTNVVTVVATDLSGNASTNTFTVVVLDNILPTVQCSPNLVRYAIGGDQGAIVDFTVRASDNLPGATVVCVPHTGFFFPLGTTTVSCTAIDAARLCSFCSFTVTVNLPPETPVNRLPGIAGQSEIIVNRPDPIAVEGIAVDDDGNPLAYTIEIDGVVVRTGTVPGALPQTVASLGVTNQFGLGNHTVIFRVSDGQTNASFTTLVRVVDNTPPIIDVPANLVVPVESGRTNARVNYTFATHDEFPGPVITTSEPPSGSRFPIGVTTVVLTATDGAGNRRTARFTVTVVDDVPPTIDCPSDLTRFNDTNSRSAVVRFTVTANDNLPGVAVTCTPASGSAFPIGSTVVTCTARDAAGLTNFCHFEITVRDLPPVVLIPTNLLVVAEPGLCSAAVPYSVRVADNAPGWSLVCSPPPGTQFPVGATPVICTAADTAGNRVTNTFTVRVQDRETPLLRLPADITVGIAATAPSAVVDYNVTATDNCPGVRFTCTPPSGAAFPAGTTIVQCAATDASGNVATASFKVIVERSAELLADVEAPLIVGLTPSKRCLWPLNRKMVNVTFKATATDNSGRPVTAEIVSICSNEADSEPGSGKSERDSVITGALTAQLRAECSGAGTDRKYTVVIAVRDAAGNTSTAVNTVWVPRDQSRRDFLIATTPPEPRPTGKTVSVQPAKKRWNWKNP